MKTLTKAFLLTGILLTGSFAASAAERTFNLRDFRAAADGRTKDTAAIAKTIAAAASAGGGIVHFPAGKYLTGAIHLRSRVTLDLAAGATVVFSTDPADYPVLKTRWEGTECYNFSPFIFGRGLQRIAITGAGTFEGQGKAWHPWRERSNATTTKLRALGNSDTTAEQRRFGTVAAALRPQFAQFIGCEDVRIEGVTFNDSPFWTINPIECTNVVVRGVTIRSTGPNTDGVDPESCRQVLIEKCDFQTGDDSIAIKSGRDADGRRAGQPSEDIVVRECKLGGRTSAIAIGSEMSGGVRRVRISDCEVRGPGRGIRIKSQRGRGGVVEDVEIASITMKGVEREAIDITMHYGGGKKLPPEAVSERTPIFRNITIRDVTCDRASIGIAITGLEEMPIERVTLKNLNLTAEKGVVIDRARQVTLDNVKINGATGVPVKFLHATDCVVDGKKVN